MVFLSLGAVVPSGLEDRLAGEVLPALEAALQRLAASSDSWLALLRQVFDARVAGSQGLFADSAERLRQELSSGAFSIHLELRSSQELQGALAAYTAAAPGGGERIYLNVDWAAKASATDLQRVLLEELGHAFDQRLNGGQDSPGDEGQAFASLVLDGGFDPSVRQESGASESGILWIDGVDVQVEFANTTFSNAYEMVYDLNNNNSIQGSLGETAALKEQSIHNFNIAGLGRVAISDGGVGQSFSGNDVSASVVTINNTTYYGWISRPIKSNGIVRGFYFWTDQQFTTLALAQQDGNRDLDGNAADNRGFLLVVDQSWFDAQIAKKSTAVTLNNAKDGNLGTVVYSEVGSSSDRVDTALNGVLGVPNLVDTTDTDQDGVANVDDLDDDNDGILDVDETGIQIKSLTNSVSYSYAQTADYAGYAAGYPAFHFGAQNSGTKNDPNLLFDGRMDTELRVHTADILEYNLNQTVLAGSKLLFKEGTGSNDANVRVYVSYDSTDPSGDANSASGGGVGWKNTLANYNANNACLVYEGPTSGDVEITVPFDIRFIQIVGLAKHGGWAELDYSSASRVFENVDTDQDGVPNYLDLDSDNDGISDLYESLGSKPSALAVAVDSAGSSSRAGYLDGTITLGDITAYNTANPSKTISTTLSSSGVWQFLGDPAVANDGSQSIDTDGDGVHDFLDLDSDGDGIPDTVEVRPSASFSTNDGDVSNEDLDGDGVIGRFDSNDATTKVFGGSFTTPVNTDSSLGGDGTTSANAGTADKVALDNKVDNELNALGAFDNKLAKLNDKKDQLVLDLGSDVPVGTTITIRAKKDDANAANKLIVNQSSADGKTLTNTVSSAFTAKDTLQDITYTTTGATGSVTRYISLKFDRNKGNLYVDGLTWQWGTTTPGFSPDYLDFNSDNDGVDDATESGLTRTGQDANNDGIDDGIGASYLDPDGKVNDPFGSGGSGSSNTPSVSGTGLKNTDAIASDVDYRSLNTGGVNITDVLVNEGSPYAVFTLSGPTAATTVKLSLIQDIDPDTADATIGTDLAASPPASGSTGSSDLQWFDGANWVNYIPNNGVSIPANGSRLVRVAIKNDTSLPVFEGPETFRLQATYGSNGVSQGGLGTIVDDGSGDWWKATNNTATPDTSGFTLDDDTPIDITDVAVNEASPYAVFDLTGNASQAFTLSLLNGSAIGGTTTPTDGSVDFSTALQVLNDGNNWVAYTAGSTINLDSTGERLVRVAIVNDVPYEGPQTFRLRATNTANGITSIGGLGTIYDEGSGDVFLAANKTTTPNISSDSGYPVLDDDRPIDVTDVVVNEASPYAVFDVEGNGGQVIKLSLAAGTATAGPDFNGTTLQYFNGTSWINYTSGSGALITLPASGELLVRVAILPDSSFEGRETFQLNVTNNANNVVSTGNGTIVDDGTGAIYPDNTTGATDNSATKDDDRVLSVNNVTVSEASLYAVFTVTANAGQKVALALSTAPPPVAATSLRPCRFTTAWPGSPTPPAARSPSAPAARCWCARPSPTTSPTRVRKPSPWRPPTPPAPPARPAARARSRTTAAAPTSSSRTTPPARLPPAAPTPTPPPCRCPASWSASRRRSRWWRSRCPILPPRRSASPPRW